MVNRDNLPFQSAVNEAEAELPRQYVERSVREIEHHVPADHQTRKNSTDPMIEILGIHSEHPTRLQRLHKLLEGTQWVEQDRIGAPKGNHVVAFAVERAILESVGQKGKLVCLAAMSGEIDVRFDASDL